MWLTLVLMVANAVSGAIAMIVAAGCLPARMLLGFFPVEVRELIRDHQDPPVGKQVLGFATLAIWLAVMVGTTVVAVRDGRAHDFGFAEMLVRLLLIFAGWKLTDIIGFDWYAVSRVHFFNRFYPELKGHEDLTNFGFNRDEQIRHTVGALVCLTLIAFFATR